jgi:hypothetical protein
MMFLLSGGEVMPSTSARNRKAISTLAPESEFQVASLVFPFIGIGAKKGRMLPGRQNIFLGASRWSAANHWPSTFDLGLPL